MLVVWHHFIEHQHWLDPHYTPSGIFSFNPSGHLSVLVFFVLSGYVIGRVHVVPLARSGIMPYLKKRFTRIYPIYFVSILVALLVAKGGYPATTIASNLTMTNNFLAPTIFENNPAWSLNFEILFYLLFIPLSYFRLNIYLVAGIFAVIGLVADTQAYYLSGGYCLGFAVWLCGVMLARNMQHPIMPSFSLMASFLLLLLSLREFNTLTVWLSKAPYLLHRPAIFEAGPVQIADLSNLPYCILLVLLFASRDFPYRKYITPLLMLLPLIAFYKRLHTPEAFQNKALILPTIFYVAVLLIYFLQRPLEQLCRRFIQRLSTTGAWSYGLYIMHFPLIAIFARIEWFSGTATTFSIRLLCYLFLCYTVSYFLEKTFQPWVRQFLIK